MEQDKKTQSRKPQNSAKPAGLGSKSSRGASVRAQKRIQQDAQKIANLYLPADPSLVEQTKKRANFIDETPKLKIVGLGGMDGGGSKNTILVEYGDDAVIIDAGNDLGVDLPGINYGIADFSYVKAIK